MQLQLLILPLLGVTSISVAAINSCLIQEIYEFEYQKYQLGILLFTIEIRVLERHIYWVSLKEVA